MKTALDILNEKGTDIICVSKEATILEALNVMNQKKIGAILIKDGNDIIGIWTERDLLKNVPKDDFDPKTAVIGEHMITGLQCVAATDTLYQLEDKFLGMRLRHLLVKQDEKYIGILSAGDVMKASLNKKTKELDELNAMVSWEYYENWRWKKKK